MAIWNLKRLQQSLSKDSPASLYLVFGEEDYLVNESLSLIQSKTVCSEWKDINIQHFEASHVSVSEIEKAVTTWPVMSSQKLVICKNSEKMKNQHWEALTPLIESPVKTCVLVFVAQKVDKQKKYFKQLNRYGICVELKTPYDSQIPTWIQYIAHSEGLQIDNEATHLIYQLVGGRLSEIKNEILKIKVHLHGQTFIQAIDVLQIASKSRVYSVFDLTDAIGKKNVIQALVQLTCVLEKNTNAVGILSLILRYFRILRQVRQAQEEKLSGQELSTSLGIPFYFFKQYQQQANLWDLHQIKRTIQLLHQTDRALKSSPLPSRIWLEHFIIKSCQ